MVTLAPNNGQRIQLQAALDDLLKQSNQLVWRLVVLAGRAWQAVAPANAPVREAHVRILREHGAKDLGGGRWELSTGFAPAWKVLEADRQTNELFAAGSEIELELEPIPEALIDASPLVVLAGVHRLLMIELGLLIEERPPVPQVATP